MGETSEAEKRTFQKEYDEKLKQYTKAMETYVPPVVEKENKEDDEEEQSEDDNEEDDDEDDEEEEDSPKKRKATSKNDAPAAKKVKTAGSSEVQAEAKKLGLHLKLKALTENAKVKSSPAEILAELQKQNGSVVAARKV